MFQNIQRRLKVDGWLAYIIIGYGILLRSVHYFSNRSFWYDEAVRAIEIKTHPLAELLQLQGFVTTQIHTAPYGFHIMQKLTFLALGDSEYALRLFPFVCGLAALLLYPVLVEKFLAKGSGLIAVCLLAVTPYFIFYSAELKPYSVDVLVTIVILFQLRRMSEGRLSIFQAVNIGVIGGVCLWLSFPAVFVLAGGCAFLFPGFWRKDPKKLLATAGIILIWAVNFLLYYHLSLRYFTQDPSLMEFWKNWYFSLSWQGLYLFSKSFVHPGGIPFVQLGAVLFILGAVDLWKTRKDHCAILILPVLVTLGSSLLLKYPFADRLILFLMPVYYIFIAAGVARLRRIFIERRPVFWACLILLMLPLLAGSFMVTLIRPIKHEEMRPVVRYLKDHYRLGDALYVYYGAAPAFEYYAEKINFKPDNVIIGRPSRSSQENYLDEINLFQREERVWVVFSHIYNNEDQLILFYLDRIGERREAYLDFGSSVYLYDLTNTGV